MASQAILSARGIKKTFKGAQEITILKEIALTVQKGESVAIMGRSGEGKSTLLQILGTLDRPDQGELIIRGLPAYQHQNTIRSECLGFIFQSFHLMDDFTVLDNVLMPAKIARKPTGNGSEAYKRALKLIEDVGLTDRKYHLAKLLSGGEKQRTAIARSLSNDPEIILADEPTGNLDYETALGVHDLLIDLSRNKEKTLIIVTHNQELANLCDRRFTLKNGMLF